MLPIAAATAAVVAVVVDGEVNAMAADPYPVVAATPRYLFPRRPERRPIHPTVAVVAAVAIVMVEVDLVRRQRWLITKEKLIAGSVVVVVVVAAAAGGGVAGPLPPWLIGAETLVLTTRRRPPRNLVVATDQNLHPHPHPPPHHPPQSQTQPPVALPTILATPWAPPEWARSQTTGPLVADVVAV